MWSRPENKAVVCDFARWLRGVLDKYDVNKDDGYESSAEGMRDYVLACLEEAESVASVKKTLESAERTLLYIR